MGICGSPLQTHPEANKAIRKGKKKKTSTFEHSRFTFNFLLYSRGLHFFFLRGFSLGLKIDPTITVCMKKKTF